MSAGFERSSTIASAGEFSWNGGLKRRRQPPEVQPLQADTMMAPWQSRLMPSSLSSVVSIRVAGVAPGLRSRLRIFALLPQVAISRRFPSA